MKLILDVLRILATSVLVIVALGVLFVWYPVYRIIKILE